jgi:DNA repair protein RadC
MGNLPKSFHASLEEYCELWQRNRKLLLKYDYKEFTDCELLEFILHFMFPYVDNSELAGLLIDRFGTFANAIDADYSSLLTVEEIDSHTASLFCMFRKLLQIYWEKKSKSELRERFDTERLKNYCVSLFINAKVEEFYCLCLSDDSRLTSAEKICSGSVRTVTLPVRSIVQSVFANNCSRLVIAHNHPAGDCLPSREDVRATENIHGFLKRMDVDLIDHIIVGKAGVTSMRECGFAYFS